MEGKRETETKTRPRAREREREIDSDIVCVWGFSDLCNTKCEIGCRNGASSF